MSPSGTFEGWRATGAAAPAAGSATPGAGFGVTSVRGDFSTRSGSHVFQVEWREGAVPGRAVSLTYDCRARKRNLVTGRILPKGAILARADLVEALVEWDFSRPLRHDPASWVGWAVRQEVPPGTLLREEMVEKSWWVTPGAKVRMVARQRKFTVETVGVARERGAAGDLVRVENLASKQVVLVRVAGPGLVEVTNGGRQ